MTVIPMIVTQLNYNFSAIKLTEKKFDLKIFIFYVTSKFI